MHIIDSGGYYGAEIMLIHLMSEQHKMGIYSLLASVGLPGESEKQIEAEARQRYLPVKAFRMHPGPNFIGASKVLCYAIKNNFDILHSHGYKGNILFGLIPQCVRRLPLVSTLHGWTATEGINKMRFYEWLDSLSLRFIDTVVLVNDGMRNHPGMPKNIKNEFRVVNNGISQEVDASQMTLAPELVNFCRQEHGYIIGAIGRLSKEKGFSYLIDALSILLEQGRNLRLLLLGEGGQRGFLETKIAKLGLGEHVRMPGYLLDAARYLRLFNVLVIPSLTEGLPITVLEAMRAGVPIAASRVGGIPNVLEDQTSAMLVPAADALALAEAIARLQDQPALGRILAGRAVEEFNRHYTSERMAIEYKRIYSRFLN